MNLIQRLLFRLSNKRKQCKCCGKTFYKPVYTWVNSLDPDDWCQWEDLASPCCSTYFIEV